jgi:hypothetical protein
VFISASTVRNILSRPRPRRDSFKSSVINKTMQTNSSRSITARHTNHVWSVDRTIVKRWGLWTTYVLVCIGHYSWKLVYCSPLEGPNAGWTIVALEQAIEINGVPKHIISDQEFIFFLDNYRHWANQFPCPLKTIS